MKIQLGGVKSPAHAPALPFVCVVFIFIISVRVPLLWRIDTLEVRRGAAAVPCVRGRYFHNEIALAGNSNFWGAPRCEGAPAARAGCSLSSIRTWLVRGCAGVRRCSRACVVLIFRFPGCPWLFLAAPGCSWLLLAAPGCSWLLLAAPGCSWLPLAASGSRWLLMAAPGRCWLLLWLLLVTPGCLWLLLDALGCSWLLLAAPGCCWLLLAAPGCSWLLMAARACFFLLLAAFGCSGSFCILLMATVDFNNRSCLGFRAGIVDMHKYRP
jgi:hypothetical protein